MPFAWAEALTAGATKIKASHVTEVHTNIDTVRGLIRDPAVGGYPFLTGWPWTHQPAVQFTDKDASVDFKESIDALDQAYDKNVCITNFANYDSGYNNNEHATHDVTYNGTVKSGYDINHRVTHYGVDNAANDSTILTGNDATIKATNNTVLDNAADYYYNVGYQHHEHGTVYPATMGTYKAAADGSECTAYNAAIDLTVYTGLCAQNDVGQNSTNWSANRGTHDWSADFAEFGSNNGAYDGTFS